MPLQVKTVLFLSTSKVLFMRPHSLMFICVALLCTVKYTGAQNAAIQCPENIIISADKGKEGAYVKLPELKGELTGSVYTPVSGSFFRLGSHSVIVTTPDGKKCSFTVLVTDNESPELSPLILSREKLWPASNKMKKVTVSYTATDNSGTVNTTIAVNSNANDGVKDWEIVNDRLLRLKASRLPDDKPRIYSITVTATDEAGNKTKRTTSIAVSKTMTAVANK